MTENESLKIMLAYKFGRGRKPRYSDDEIDEAFNVAITALKEIQLYKDGKLCLVPKDVYSKQCCELDTYKEIGTVDECRKAVKKQKAKKIVYESDSVFCDGFTHYRMGKCPVCDRYYNSNDDVNYCSKCGQKLDWSEEDE